MTLPLASFVHMEIEAHFLFSYEGEKPFTAAKDDVDDDEKEKVETSCLRMISASFDSYGDDDDDDDDAGAVPEKQRRNNNSAGEEAREKKKHFLYRFS